MANDIQQLDFSVNLLQAILWQYDGAANTVALLNAKQAWYDENQTAFWNNWLTNVFDLRTCNEFGLVVWAIILGIPLSYISAGVINPNQPFGFGPDTIGGPANGRTNFNFANFADNQSQAINLTLEEKRTILLLRYRQITSRGTVTEINKTLNDILVPTYGPMYVRDNLDMTQTIVCVNGLPAFLSFLFSEFDLIPRPAGVQSIAQSGAVIIIRSP